MLKKDLYNKISFVGRTLFERGLVDVRSGNVSVRLGKDKMLIKKTGENMGMLNKSSFVILPISKKTPIDEMASSDLDLHRKIYVLGGDRFGAILHSHPPDAVVLSHIFDEISPTDYEARLYVEKIKFVEYEKVPETVLKYKVCVAKFHGIFCSGKNIEESLLLNLIVANSLKIALCELLLGIRKKRN